MDDGRLREVYAVAYPRLVGQLVGVTGDPAEAEDVVMEAFARAAPGRSSFHDADNPEAWLRTTAVNTHRSRWRKLRNGRRAQQRLLPPRDPVELEDHLEVINALRALPEQQRHVIVLLARRRLENNDDLGVESRDVLRVEILLCVESQPIDAGPQRLARRVEGAQPPVVVGVAAPDVIPPAIVCLPFERDAEARGRAALRRIQNVSRNSAH